MRSVRVRALTKKLHEQMKQLDHTREELKKEPDGQRSLTDPDSRSMKSQAKGTGCLHETGTETGSRKPLGCLSTQ